MKTQREILDEMAATEMAQGTYDLVSLSDATEEAAWQNAAESLPAQSEQEVFANAKRKVEPIIKAEARANGTTGVGNCSTCRRDYVFCICPKEGRTISKSGPNAQYKQKALEKEQREMLSERLKGRPAVSPEEWGTPYFPSSRCPECNWTTGYGHHASCSSSNPVAPVEAKEKCELCGQMKDNGWRHNYESGYGDFATISCSAHVAEPKPTPSEPESKTHDLKVWPEYYRVIIEGRKFFEIRKNDRDYKVGDLLTLREYNPEGNGSYTGYYTTVEVSYVLYGGSWGLPDDMCVMSIVKPGQVGSTSRKPLEDFGYQPQPDSSSISTEQTFEEWFDIWERDTEGFTEYEITLCESSARAAWNAAKGQSNGR